ncbi:TPA: zinc ribbon domain-containing protein, partial [Clostridioides difficile]
MSKMIQCKSCSKEIASNAKSCPNCGAKNKKPFYKRGWFIVIVVLVLLYAIGTSGSGGTDDTAKGNDDGT